jgi:hypothetical protein
MALTEDIPRICSFAPHERLRTGDEKLISKKSPKSSSSQTLHEVTFLTRSACAVRAEKRARDMLADRAAKATPELPHPEGPMHAQDADQYFDPAVDSDCHRPDFAQALKDGEATRQPLIPLAAIHPCNEVRDSALRGHQSDGYGRPGKLKAQSLEIIGYEPIPSLPAL